VITRTKDSLRIQPKNVSKETYKDQVVLDCDNMPTLNADQLRAFSSRIFKALNVPKEDAELVSNLLVEANLTGFDSHGVIRIPIYARGIKMGAVKPGADIKIIRETPSTAVIDGEWNLGQVVAKYAMKVCIEKARNSVIGLVTAKNSQHAGRLNTYAEMAMAQNMIGIASVNSASYVAPFGGKTKQLGTNPLCFAIPSGKEPPMILDMATSVWARGKIMVHLARGEELPEEIFMDPDGNSTTDPSWYTLTGALTEGGVSNSEEYRSRPFYGGNGIFMMAIDVAQITELDQFKKRVDNLLSSVKNSATAPGYNEVLIPGEPERRKKAKRLKEGIFIEDKTWGDLTSLATELNVKIPK